MKKRVFTLLLALLFAFAAFAFAACAEENAGTGGETDTEEGGGTEEPGTDDPSEEEPAATLSFAAAEVEVTRGETYEVTVTLGGALPAGRVFWYAQDDTVVFY